MERRLEKLEERTEEIEAAIRQSAIHVTEMHERTESIMRGQTTVRNLVFAVLATALTGAAAVTVKAYTNETEIGALRGEAVKHTAEGHPGLRREVAEVATEVRTITVSIGDLGERLDRYRESNNEILRHSGATRAARERARDSE